MARLMITARHADGTVANEVELEEHDVPNGFAALVLEEHVTQVVVTHVDGATVTYAETD